MNPKLAIFYSRRSVRRYRDEPVPDGLIQDLLEAAMAAPSAVAKDPWEIIVVKDKGVLQTLSAGLPNGTFLQQAGVGFVMCGDLAKAHDSLLSYMIQDCSAAIENILLAASALGLGACWLGVHPREERMAHIREVLGIPEAVTPIGAIAAGWPEEQPPARSRYTEDKVHRERW